MSTDNTPTAYLTGEARHDLVLFALTPRLDTRVAFFALKVQYKASQHFTLG